jgi:hypothetical protein
VGLLVVGELAESVVVAGRLAIVPPVGLGDGAWSVAGYACRIHAASVSSTCNSARVGDESWLREGSHPLQPGSFLLIRDTWAPSTRVALGSTPSYRSGPPSGSGKAQISPGYGPGAHRRRPQRRRAQAVAGYATTAILPLPQSDRGATASGKWRRCELAPGPPAASGFRPTYRSQLSGAQDVELG